MPEKAHNSHRRRSSNGRGEEAVDSEAPVARAFWSGTLSFGLVSIPVDLLAANRGRGISMRMIDARDGSSLKREYYCPEHDATVDSDDIVLGYPVDKGKFVIVSDEELESVAPEKSRDIDLKRFVDAKEIDPFFFERSYFLVPSGSSSKAYHLLTDGMARMKRAGIATFVMHGKEYLVAIFAEGGLLRAATMRFEDELRAAKDIGLPSKTKADPKAVKRLARHIDDLTASKVDLSAFEDRYAADLTKLVEKKRKHKDDVVRASTTAVNDEEGEANIIDLMKILKERVGTKSAARQKGAPRSSRRPRTKTAAKKKRGVRSMG